MALICRDGASVCNGCGLCFTEVCTVCDICRKSFSHGEKYASFPVMTVCFDCLTKEIGSDICRICDSAINGMYYSDPTGGAFCPDCISHYTAVSGYL